MTFTVTFSTVRRVLVTSSKSDLNIYSCFECNQESHFRKLDLKHVGILKYCIFQLKSTYLSTDTCIDAHKKTKNCSKNLHLMLHFK